MTAAESFSADYNWALERANEILISSKVITTFPFRASKLIEEMGREIYIPMMPFSWIEQHGMTGEEVTGSPDGAIIEMSGMHIFFYNERESPKRLTFTACHEAGHIYLGHPIEKLTEYRKSKNPRFKSLYDKCEKEANFFATQILMPEQVLKRLFELGCRIDEFFLQEKFGVSEKAASIRKKNMRIMYNWRIPYWENDKSLNDAVLLKFSDFINRTAPRRKSYEEEYAYEEEMEAERNRWIANGY